MKVYIAGKISGDRAYFAKFWRAETALENEGFTVLNPAFLPEGMTQADYMRIDLAMLDTADAAVFLPDWVHTTGAVVEHDLCCKTGKPFVVWNPDMDAAQVVNRLKEAKAAAERRTFEDARALAEKLNAEEAGGHGQL